MLPELQGAFGIGAGMDKWEFFQDIKDAWRWRRTSADGRATSTSTESYPTRAGAVSDARMRGYTERPAPIEPDRDETFVHLKALSADALAASPLESELKLRQSGYNPYDTGTFFVQQKKGPATEGGPK
jgi:hypothetical protein